MVDEIKSDLLTCGADIICYQTNVYGVMGAGVAAADAKRKERAQ